jgi:putative thiamine transport system ATP-binding protein
MTSAKGLVLSSIDIALAHRPLIALEAMVAPGTVLTIMGPSGSGKSTLLAYVGGFLDPVFTATGAVTIDGLDLTALPAKNAMPAFSFRIRCSSRISPWLPMSLLPFRLRCAGGPSAALSPRPC